MFLKVDSRSKDGKEHHYYSLVESVPTSRGPQHRTLAYLGELNGSSEAAWRRSIAVFNGEGTECQLELFAADAPVVPSGERVAEVVLDRVRWERARDFGELFLVQLPLGYEVFHGNRAEPTTLGEMMAKMEALYGKASRIWVFDRGVASEKSLFIICYSLFAYGTPVLNGDPEDAQKYLNTWSSSVIFLMLGGFFLADAMKKTGLDRETFGMAVGLFGRRPGNVLLGLMLTTAVLSMVMSNTETTAMMIAAVTPFLRSYGPRSGYARAVLVGIPAAAAVGGMGTIIGSPPNAVAVGALEQAGVKVSFLDWMLLGVAEFYLGQLDIEGVTLVTLMIALSASAALLLPVSTPPNAIAFSTGMVEAREFRLGGVLIGGIGPILVVAWVWLLWTLLE